MASACGGSDENPTAPSAPTSPAPGGSQQTINIQTGAEFRTADAFGANPLTIAAGTTVAWVNNDATPHDPRSDAAGVFTLGTIRSGGGRATATFANPGTIRYHCGFHPNMVGTIVVQ